MGKGSGRSLSVGEILSDAMSLFTSDFPLFLSIALLSQIFHIINQVLLMFFKPDSSPNMMIAPIVLGVLGFCMASFGAIALIFAISQKYQGIEVDIGRALTDGTKGKFFKYIFTSILFGLVVAGGFVLLIVPGIYFTVIFYLVTVIVVLEQIHIIDAFKRSAELVKGNFGSVFLVILVTVIISVMMPVAVAAIKTFINSGTESMQQLIVTLWGVVLMPLVTAISVVLYYHITQGSDAEVVEEQVSVE